TGEELAEHVPEGILFVGQGLLPMRFEDDEPASAGLGVDAPAAPLAPFGAAFGPPGAVKAAVIVAEREPALAAGFRLLVSKDEAIALDPALQRGRAQALVEAVNALRVVKEPHRAVT